MKIIPSSNRGTKQSKLLAVRHGSQVDIYNVSDWSLRDTFDGGGGGLSCGTAIISPPSGLEIDPTNTWFLTSGDNDAVGAYLLSDGSE